MLELEVDVCRGETATSFLKGKEIAQEIGFPLVIRPSYTLGGFGGGFVNKPEDFDEWVDKANRCKWEGLMLRRNTIYEGKRTKNLLKVKNFHDAEYKVIDANFEDMSVVREGREVQENMLAQVWIEHKGYKVKVGSGFNQEQRIKYKKEPIIGKIITVQYFEETKNQEGGISLRFPTVKVIHGDKRTT